MQCRGGNISTFLQRRIESMQRHGGNMTFIHRRINVKTTS